ncbi:MAG: hypothetical protein ACI35P_18695 [Bacillus sp. (in: firmicutes)]
MSNEKLFTAIYIPETPFINYILRPKMEKRHHFELVMNEKMTNTLFHFLYKKNASYIHCFYFIGDIESESERYLFVENNDLYHEFVGQFWGGGQRYWECGMDTYLDVDDSEQVLLKLKNAYNSRGYEEDEEGPMCHFFGQQSWHGDAYLIANRTALLELREAIDTALKYDESRLDLFPSDGEGYDLYIKCTEDDFDWETLDMPYHDRECYDPDRTKTLAPQKMFEKYKLT